MPLKIVIICASDSGGAGKAAYRQHRALVDKQVDSTMLVLHKETSDPTVKVMPGSYTEGVITTALKFDPAETAWKSAIKQWKTGVSDYSNRPAGFEQFSSPVSSVRLDLVKEFIEADIVHLHWMPGLLDYNHSARALQGKPVVWTLHDMNPFTGGCHYSAGCRRYEQSCGTCPQLGAEREADLSQEGWRKRRELYQQLDLHVVVLSEWLGELAQKSGLFANVPLHHIPNSLNTEIYKPDSRGEFRKWLGVAETERLVLFGSDSVKNLRKGFPYLVQALEILSERQNYTNVTLGFFGRMKEEVRLPASFRVLPLGTIKDEQTLAGIYAAADVFVLPSLEDNLPNTLLESFACGTPVVGFDIGGIPDVIEHKKTGYLAQPFAAESITDGIEWVLSERENGRDFKAVCRKKVEDDFSPEMQAQALIDLYKGLVKPGLSGIEIKQEVVMSYNNNSNGGFLLEQGDLPGAMLAFRKALEKDMSDPDALSGLAVSMLRAGESDVALQLLGQTLKNHPENETVLRRAFEVFRNGDEWLPVEKHHLLYQLFLVCSRKNQVQNQPHPVLA